MVHVASKLLWYGFGLFMVRAMKRELRSKKQRIIELIDEGKSPAEAAAETNSSRSYVYNVSSREREQKPQGHSQDLYEKIMPVVKADIPTVPAIINSIAPEAFEYLQAGGNPLGLVTKLKLSPEYAEKLVKEFRQLSELGKRMQEEQIARNQSKAELSGPHFVPVYVLVVADRTPPNPQLAPPPSSPPPSQIPNPMLPVPTPLPQMRWPTSAENLMATINQIPEVVSKYWYLRATCRWIDRMFSASS